MFIHKTIVDLVPALPRLYLVESLKFLSYFPLSRIEIAVKYTWQQRPMNLIFSLNLYLTMVFLIFAY